MLRTLVIALFVAAVVFTGPASLLRADDEDAPKLSVRMYAVRALTHGRMPFRSQFPPVQDPRNPGDALLLVSSDAPEPRSPVGSADELIELLKSTVVPAFWEQTEGADVRCLGEGTLVVRATESAHEALGHALVAFEKRWLKMVTVELQAVRLSSSQRTALTRGGDASRLDNAQVDTLLATGAAGPALRLLVENGTSAEGFGGAQRAFLRDHNIEVAQSTGTSNSIIGVANPGLAAVVRPMLGGTRGSRLRLAVRASLSHEGAFRAQTTINGDTVELPAHALLDLYDDVLLEPGRWALVGGVAHGESTEHWMLLARATPHTLTVPAAAKSFVLDYKAERPSGPYENLAVRMFDVGTLTEALYPAPGTGAFLWDTAAAPPRGEEMPEEAPPLSVEALVELVREASIAEYWEEAATIEGRGRTLIVRHTPATLDSLGGMIGRLAREVPGVIETSVTAVEVSNEVARALSHAMAGKDIVLTDGASAVLTKALRENAARTIGEAQVASTGGFRNTICSGKHVSYLQTYAVEVAESAARARAVTGQYLAGFEVELEAHPLVGGSSALLQLRLMHTRSEGETRTKNTAHGPVELPALATARVRTTVTLPLGQTAWVATTRGAGRPVLFLATARLQKR